MRVSEEQKELLSEMVATETWPAIAALLEEKLDSFKQKVLSCSLEEIVNERMKLDGAIALARSVLNLKDELRNSEKKNGRRKYMAKIR